MIDKRFQSMLDEIRTSFNKKTEPSTINSNVLLVDGLNTFIRAFAVVPILNDDGLHIGGICGFLRSIGYAIEITKPTRVVVVFDGKGGSVRRKKLYPEYKNRRNPNVRLNRNDVFITKDEESHELVRELVRVVKYLEKLPVTVLSLDNVEADDVIAYIATHVLTDSKISIMSTDKDFLQLVDDRITVWSPTKKKIYTTRSVVEEFQIPPVNMCLCRAINSKGDKSDNISGIRGVGEKTIIKKYPMLIENKEVSVKELIDFSKKRLEEGNAKKPDSTYKKIVDGESIIERNIDLMQLRDVDISANSKSIIVNMIGAIVDSLNKLDFMKMVFEDKLWAGISNMEVWLREHFGTLDRFAVLSKPKETVNE